MNLLSYIRSPDGSNVSRTQKTMVHSITSMVDEDLQRVQELIHDKE